jgi:integrase
MESRIIRLHAHQMKERQPKRVPIHRLLVPILKRVGRVRSISSDNVFLTDRGKPPFPDSLKKPWKIAIKAVGLNPAPTIHDLRHVWKTNAMRSRMDFELREAIMGHAIGIAGRYGRMSDDDLVRAVNGMRFDEGSTEIWVARRKKENP